jgi:NDP-sugar pyrophosphorylase family protein
MSKLAPTTAMVLAAGLGTRLRPLTETKPKPLIAVHGVPMIFRSLQAVVGAGMRRAVVNTHHFAELLRNAVGCLAIWKLFSAMKQPCWKRVVGLSTRCRA